MKFFKVFLTTLALTAITTSLAFANVDNTISSEDIMTTEKNTSLTLENPIITPFTITQDTIINANQSLGGRQECTFSHYGNYDSRAYFENIGNRAVRIQTYTPTGYKVHDLRLEPGESYIGYFTQSVLMWNMGIGKGRVHVSTYDGGTGQVYFRYNILD